MPSTNVTVNPARRLTGRVVPPGDKSISHRYAMLAALADGSSVLGGFAPGADCRATLGCLASLGVTITRDRDDPLTVRVLGRGLRGLSPSPTPLDVMNSGTSIRLLSGVAAAHPFMTTLTGDESLRQRPMGRVIEPLRRMGARIESADGRAPLRVTGTDLTPVHHVLAVASAQVKSAILLAGLQTPGTTTVTEPAATRNHTELAFEAFGVAVQCRGTTVSIGGMQRLHPVALTVPGDASSAAFWAVAAAGLPGSDIEIAGVGLNPTRVAFLDVLRRAGARVETEATGMEGTEPSGTVRVRHGTLRPIVLGPADVPALIDELPALAALATFGGAVDVSGAAELRVKESDRISCLAAGLRALGGLVEERPDGFRVSGDRRLGGGTADAAGDHRLAMAFAIAALGARAPSVITGAQAVAVSYPGFFEVMGTLTQ